MVAFFFDHQNFQKVKLQIKKWTEARTSSFFHFQNLVKKGEKKIIIRKWCDFGGFLIAQMWVNWNVRIALFPYLVFFSSQRYRRIINNVYVISWFLGMIITLATKQNKKILKKILKRKHCLENTYYFPFSKHASKDIPSIPFGLLLTCLWRYFLFFFLPSSKHALNMP